MNQAVPKKYLCPALDKEITRVECASKRSREISCPPDCPWSPWNPNRYGDADKIREKTNLKATERLIKERARTGNRLYVSEDPVESLIAFHKHFFITRDTHGKNFDERWKEENYRELRNDERLYWESLSDMRIRLLEIQSKQGDDGLWVFDHLDPEQGIFLVKDRRLNQHACRFELLIAPTLRFPHYDVLLGIASPFFQGQADPIGPTEILDLIVQHLGGPPPARNPNWYQWIFFHISEIYAACHAIKCARFDEQIKVSEFIHTKLLYRISEKNKKINQIWDSLDQHPDLLPCDPPDDASGTHPAGCWEILGPLGRGGLGRIMLGTLTLYPDHTLELNCAAHHRLKELVVRFKEIAGLKVKQIDKIETDQRAAIFNNEEVDTRWVPPSLLKIQGPISNDTTYYSEEDNARAPFPADKIRYVLLAIPDIPQPSMNGVSIREAAESPTHRPQAVKILKSIIYQMDESIRNGKPGPDAAFLAEELGYVECFTNTPTSKND